MLTFLKICNFKIFVLGLVPHRRVLLFFMFLLYHISFFLSIFLPFPNCKLFMNKLLQNYEQRQAWEHKTKSHTLFYIM